MAPPKAAKSNAGEKIQRNFRLTQSAAKIIERMALVRGISESAVIELLARDAGRLEDEGRGGRPLAKLHG